MHGNQLLFVFSILFSAGVFAQPCSQFPADCPSDRQLGNSVSRMVNPVLPQEIHMEIRLHDQLTNLMQTLSAKKGWELFPYDESDGSGFLNADRSAPLEYSLRPPHDYEISFILIVNQDSLLAWQKWEREFNVNMLAELEKMKSTGDFSAVKNIQSGKKIKTAIFRNASMIRVKFEINPDNAIVTSILDNVHKSGALNIGHAPIAFEVHIDKPDEQAIFDLNQLNRSSDLALMLFGKWNPIPDSYQYYHPSFTNDRKNTDKITPKIILSDKVRVIAMHIEGSSYYIHSFLQVLDTENINNIILQ